METKFKIVETAEYYLAASDEEIKENDLIIANGNIKTIQDIDGENDEIITDGKYDYVFKPEQCKKIIAYQPKGNASELDLPLLPEMVVEPRGFDEFEYSEEDLRKAIEMARGIREGNETFDAEDISGCTEVCTYDWKFEFDEDEIIQSLKQPKPTWFVAETKFTGGTYGHGVFELKTTTLDGKTYLVGTYLYE
jgi:hypothetical protein